MIDLAATDKILENGTSNTSIAYVAALLICKDNVIKKKKIQVYSNCNLLLFLFGI